MYLFATTESPLFEILPPGTGVWVRRACGDKFNDVIPAHITGFDDVTGAYTVAPDADPHRPFFARPADIQRRFVGEVAPGVSCFSR